MSKENKVKIFIVLVLLSICCITFFIVYLNKKEKTLEIQPNNNPFSLQDVVEYSSFFSINNDLNEYLKYNYYQESNALFELLNKEYITKNNITKDNILTKLKLYDETVSIKTKNMYYEENGNIQLYYVIGDIISTLYDEINVIEENVKFFITVDYDTMAFNIYPIYDEINEIPMENKFPNILLNQYNGIKPSGIVTDNFICNLYYSDYLDKLNNDIASSYNLLAEEFKNKNYSDKDKYESFIKEKLTNISYDIATCNKVVKENKRIYTIKDVNNNIFNITEEKIMNYKVDFRLN